MNYVELLFTVSPKDAASDILIAELSEVGFDTFTEIDQGFSAYIPEEHYSKSDVESLVEQYAEIFEISYFENVVVQQNWNALWESSFEPIDVDGKCYIRAPFHEAKANYKYDIVIEPKMSFGTGHHDTTQLMMRQMMTIDIKGKTILDMGCGTGVLAILASKLGATDITAIDIDEWSYENTLENVQTNMADGIKVLKGDATLLEARKFHTILANINKNILLSDMETYVNCLDENGDLLLSGFFETDVKELTEKTTSLGLTFQSKLVNSSWAMLYFTK